MEEIIFHFRCYSGFSPPTDLHNFPPQNSKILTFSRNAPPRRRRPLRLSRITPISFPEMHPKLPPTLRAAPPSEFHEKAFFLDSLGIDLLAAAAAHPPLAAVPLDGVRSTVAFLRSVGFTNPDLRRISGMCPEVLALAPDDLVPVFTFLLREAGVSGRDLRRVINRRPRLLVSDVAGRLRPTLYFLQTLGIAAVERHTALLSCSVEDKFLPRLEFLQRAGFSSRDSRAMARKVPQIFCYSIEENLKPKFEFFKREMGRELRELRDFPQYFSFSLPNRIQPRHQACEENGVYLALPALLRSSDEMFDVRLQVCVSSSPPLRRSPLWQEDLNWGL